MGINIDNIEFEIDYSKLTNFNSESLRNSYKYSDIIVGPMPHSMENNGDFSSLIARMKNEPSQYPKIHFSQSGLRNISISFFQDALKNTRYYLALFE